MANQNERIKAQIANGAKTMTKISTQGSITIPTFQKWLHETNTFDFNKRLLDLSESMIEKLQYLLHGKPYIIEHTSKVEGVGKFAEEIMLQEVMFALERILFKKYSGFVIIEKIGTAENPKVQLRLADPNFPNFVARLGNVKVRAEMWSAFTYNKAKYYIRQVTTPTKILTDVFSYGGNDLMSIEKKGKQEDLKEFNKLLPKSLQIKGEIPNPYKFINVVEVQYKPSLDYSWSNRDELAPERRIEDKQAILDETTKIMLTEQYTNRTKMLVDKDLLASADVEDLAKIGKENIIGVVKDSGNMDGDNKVVQFVQGDPKLDQYYNAIKNIISLAVADLKLSEMSEEQAAPSATGEIYNKGNDVETGNTLQIFRQKAISEILEKAWAMKNNNSFEEYAIDLSNWNVQLIPNVIMNEAKMTDIIVKQLGAGLINMVQAKVKLEGISSEDAENSLLEEDAEGIINPTLIATTSFGDGEDDDEDGEDEADSETGNPKPK